MLDFITSKMAMMIAAIIILTSALGIYALQREQTKDLELNNIADKIAGAIENINTLQGETKVNVTFDIGKEGIYIDPTVNGKDYEILISQYKIMITQMERRAISNFVTQIHLWPPLSNTYNLTEIENIDDSNRTLEFLSGDDFKIQRKLLEINGENEYRTFVYMGK